MAMFSGLARLFGAVSVKEVGNRIRISGIPADTLRLLLKQEEGMSRILRNLCVSGSDNNTIVIPKFFAVEFVYILEEVALKKCSWKMARTIRRIVDLMLERTWLKQTLDDPESIFDLSRLRLTTWTPKPHQREALEKIGVLMPKYDLYGYLVALPPGTGKALTLDTPIKVPGGWKRMGDIKVGDFVIARDGTITKVTAVYPQGKTDAYLVTFADGRCVKTCGEHLWKSFYKDATQYSKRWDTRTTKEIKRLISLKTPRIYIPLCEPEISPEVDLPMDPWHLGYILGNGDLTQGRVHISTKDDYVRERFGLTLPPQMVMWGLNNEYDTALVGAENGKNLYIDILRDLDLMEKLSTQKHIPQIYLNSSIEQRFELLRGLMDSDGAADKGGASSYSTSSKQLCDDVVYLIRSLGGIASVHEYIPTYTYKGEKKTGKISYNINIRFKTPEDLFSLPRKKERVSNENQYCEDLKLEIVSIEKIEDEETQCITVDHPEHLYVVNDFIVTHNTATDLFVTTTIVPPEVAEIKIIISPKNATGLVWEPTISAFFKKPPTMWLSSNGGPAPETGVEYYIFHFEALDRALALAEALLKQGKRYFVTIDESHNFNTADAQRTKRLIQLCTMNKKNPIYSLWMSGSPIKAKGEEMIPLIRCIDPMFDDEAAAIFKKIFNVDADVARAMLAHRLGQITFKVPKVEVSATLQPTVKMMVKLKNSTPFLTETVKVEMKAFMEQRMEHYKKELGPAQAKFDECIDYHRRTIRTNVDRRRFDEYMQIVNRLKVISRRGGRPQVEDLAYCKTYETNYLIPSLPTHMRTQFKKCRSMVKSLVMKVQGEALGNILAKRRAQCASQLGQACHLENIISNALAKTMVFSSYVGAVTDTMAYLEKLGFAPSGVYGKTNANLDNIIKAFYKNPEINPVVATYKSLSTAVPVTCANTLVMLDVPPRQYIWDQTVARIDRMGQENPTYCIELYLDTGKESNISTSMGDILAWSAEMVAAYLGEEVPVDDKITQMAEED